MTGVSRTTASAALLACVAILSGQGAAAGPRLSDWKTLQSDQFGFMIAYPSNVFAPDPTREQEGGHILVSRDGKAWLLVAAFENEGQASLRDYRNQLLEENYPGADLDYAPVKSSSFILSGTKGDTHFYYKVSFTCGGRLINSWALIYPLSERRFYDRVVEAVARTYTPGAGRTGECD
jgi:hypothetical protein